MFHLLIDTSVWLDLAADQRQSSLLDVLVEFLGAGQATLVLPNTVVTEFQQNRERVAKASARSLASHFGQVRDAWAAAGSVDTDLSFLSLLELYGTEIAERRMPTRRVVEALDVIEHV